ncbi:MAG: arylsulfatase [Sphingobacteriaceae bacterium]
MFKHFLQLSLLFILLSSSGYSQKVKKPHIIYILTDDMGYGDLSCYGQENFNTPTLDSLAANGVLFRQHYSGSPVCAPSRASLMTGRDPGHSWIRGNYETGPYGFGSGLELRSEDVTLAEMLKQAAYKTAVIGKWGMGMQGSTGHPLKQGFDYFYGYLNQAHAHYQFPQFLYRNEEKVQIEENAGGKLNKFSGDLITSEALTYLNNQNNKDPFFLYLAYITPHAEMIVPDDSLFRSFKGKFKETPYVKTMKGSNGKDTLGVYGSSQYPIASYATMVVRLDRDIAKIIQKLKEKGLDKNTIIMFSSDNGSHKEGGANPLILNNSGGLRGAKRDVYEGGIRVPFIVAGAGIKKGVVSNHISGFWDIMPTLANYAGVDLTSKDIPSEGISLYASLSGDQSKQKTHKYLYWEFHENKVPDQAIRMGKWKGVRHGPTNSIELYDLDKDRSETTNLATQFPEVVKKMEGILKNARTPNPYWKIDN